ncbi:hypothetical protein SDC9_130956 [bioreactor metagenome]|uniref:Uncharacterized protein n=1 Tax=bioreactor metagenome TaxID=1076179 RepID=A0A645D3Z4_9ZZZZ
MLDRYFLVYWQVKAHRRHFGYREEVTPKTADSIIVDIPINGNAKSSSVDFLVTIQQFQRTLFVVHIIDIRFGNAFGKHEAVSRGRNTQNGLV